ncbi:MAG: hypothetical protein ACLQU3_22805 [Limisphaerales bacterium]
MMKSISWRLGLAAACAAVALFGRVTPVVAQEPDRGGTADRLERLERRVNDMAQRQEQLMRRLGAQEQGEAPMAAPGREDLRPLRGLPDRPGMARPMPTLGSPALAGVAAPAGPPAGAAQFHKDIAGLMKLCLLVGFVFNILLAVWIYSDIRKRGEGSGIFIALALLAGIPAAIIYSLVRIGDKKT